MSDPPDNPDRSQSPPGGSASGNPEVIAVTLTEVYGESALQVVLHQLCHSIIAGDAEGERAWFAVADVIERQVGLVERSANQRPGGRPRAELPPSGDPRGAALALIADRGWNVMPYIHMNADRARRAGDHEAGLAWRRIAAAVVDMRRTRPGAG